MSMKSKWRQISYELHLKECNGIRHVYYYLTKSTSTELPTPKLHHLHQKASCQKKKKLKKNRDNINKYNV